jgi:hypothetical protein
MKCVIVAACILFTGTVSAQNYPFAKDFVPGTIILKDSIPKKGLIKWFPSPTEKLHFKAGDQQVTAKYMISDLLGFSTDSLQFKTLSNIAVYGEDYKVRNKMSLLKQSFGQVIYTGKINIYYVLYYGYDPLQGSITTFPNIIFEKIKENKPEYAAFPVRIRMGEKKYEQAKQNLVPFFSEYPAILKKLKVYSPDSNIFTLVEYIKQIPEIKNGQQTF